MGASDMTGKLMDPYPGNAVSAAGTCTRCPIGQGEMEKRNRENGRESRARIIFSTINDYDFAAKLLFSASMSVNSTLEMSGEVMFRAIGGGNSYAFGIGFSPILHPLPPPSNLPNPILPDHELPSHWP